MHEQACWLSLLYVDSYRLSVSVHSNFASYEDDEDADSHSKCTYVAPSSICVLPVFLPNNVIRDPEELSGGW